MNQRQQPSFIAWRFYLTLAFITLAVAGLLWRVFDLAILDQHFLRHQGDERVLRLVSTPPFRGMIVDRNGFPLAVSTMVYSVWINPQEFAPEKDELMALSQLIKMNYKDLRAIAKVNQKKKREFLYLRRALAPDIAEKIKALNMDGVYLQQEYRRYYPEGEVAAHVIGFTNIDDQGQEGLELGYNQWLAGEMGKRWVIKDRIGRVIANMGTVQEQKAGHDLVLSIDRRIQYLAYRELIAGVTQNNARAGSAIVLDTKTGEILAMVNYPSFNPNNRPAHMSEVFRNRAITDTFEPGSTIKAFTIASALETRKFSLNSLIDTSPGWMRVGHNIVRDEKDNGMLSMEQILQYSSNMGAAKIALSLPPNEEWNLLHRVGFGESTGVNFPGEQDGTLIQYDPKASFALATLSFGYGLSTTALQLARAYSVLANDGVKLPLSMLKLDQSPQGERVLDSKVSKELLMLMESIFKKGSTASVDSRVPGYRVAGKTGTAWKVGAHGYDKHRYTSSFVGIAPLTNPRLIVIVVIHDPHGKYYLGGFVSGPVFSRIMEGTLRILDIPPDDTTINS